MGVKQSYTQPQPEPERETEPESEKGEVGQRVRPNAEGERGWGERLCSHCTEYEDQGCARCRQYGTQ